jgi:uncharacterized protein (DUF427 family)
MSLTIGSGPLAPSPAPGNYEIAGPAHRILFEPLGRRVRLELGGETVIDTEDAHLLHETSARARLYVPLSDVRSELLRPSATRSRCPFKGAAVYRSVQVGGRVAQDALWLYEQPLPPARWLRGKAGVEEARFDRLLDEEERVLGHLHDPYHRVDVRSSGRHVRVTGPAGEPLAETRRPLVLAETGLPRRLLVPWADVSVALARSTRTTSCPYKGVATHWDLPGGGPAAVSWETPPEGTTRLRHHLAFEGDGVVVHELD